MFSSSILISEFGFVAQSYHNMPASYTTARAIHKQLLCNRCAFRMLSWNWSKLDWKVYIISVFSNSRNCIWILVTNYTSTLNSMEKQMFSFVIYRIPRNRILHLCVFNKFQRKTHVFIVCSIAFYATPTFSCCFHMPLRNTNVFLMFCLLILQQNICFHAILHRYQRN